MGSWVNINSLLRSFYIFSILFLIFSCDTEKSDPDKSGWGMDFFPLEGNSYKIYNVTNINYSIQGDVDTVNYLLKEVVADSFLNLNNEYTYLLNRYKKAEPDSDWMIDSVWTANKSEQSVVVTENNIPYVKLVFPIKEGKTWDGNKMNTLDAESYTMQNIGKEGFFAGVQYPTTLTVIHMDNPDTILIRDKRMEVFGKNIGLIYSEKIQINYCTELDCIGEGIIDSGSKFRQELIAHGKE